MSGKKVSVGSFFKGPVLKCRRESGADRVPAPRKLSGQFTQVEASKASHRGLKSVGNSTAVHQAAHWPVAQAWPGKGGMISKGWKDWKSVWRKIIRLDTGNYRPVRSISKTGKALE